MKLIDKFKPRNRCKQGRYVNLLMVIICAITVAPVFAASKTAQDYVEQANQALSKAQTRDAEYAYHRAIYMDPSLLPAYLSLLDIYIVQRRYPMAQQILDKAKALFPEQAGIWLSEGLLKRDQGEKSQAEAAYRKAEAMGQNNITVLQRVSGFYALMGNLAATKVVNQRIKQLENATVTGEPQ